MMSREEYDDEMKEYHDQNGDLKPIKLKPRAHNALQLQSMTKKKKKQIRPKVQSKWGSEDILKLIQAVKERPDMWNKEMEEYKLPKALAWQEVAKTIGKYSSEECKAKWNNLRVTYNINLARYRSSKSGQGSDETKNVTWQYFHPMLFLEASDVRQPTQSTQSTPSVHLEAAVTDSSITSELESSITMSSPTFTGICGRKENNLKRPAESPLPTPSNSNKMASRALHVMSNRSTKDEYSAFGEYIAAELRSIHGPRAAYVKRKVNRALLDVMDEVALMDDSAFIGGVLCTPMVIANWRASNQNQNTLGSVPPILASKKQKTNP